jgi:hypothetical protein
VLAIRRGEAEGFLSVRVAAPEEEILAGLRTRFVRPPARRSRWSSPSTDAYRG